MTIGQDFKISMGFPTNLSRRFVLGWKSDSGSDNTDRMVCSSPEGTLVSYWTSGWAEKLEISRTFFGVFGLVGFVGVEFRVSTPASGFEKPTPPFILVHVPPAGFEPATYGLEGRCSIP